MDPQMVWDMMDECDAKSEELATPCRSEEGDGEPASEGATNKRPAGWMGFSLYG